MKTRIAKLLRGGTLLALPLLTSILDAQTGVISGQVMDASQAVVPGATVTLDNPANGTHRVVVSNNVGRYTFPDVAIGRYNVSAARPGFQTEIKQGVEINVGAAITVDFSLPTGQVSEQVQVTAETSALQTEGSNTGGVMENRQLVDLPINGRDYARFSLLMPGAIARSNYIADLAFNGLHTVHNQFAIDGVDATRVDQPYMSNGYERGARLLTGSLDTIAEFRVQTSNYQAQYGRSAGTNINIVSKSGTNNFHGTLFEFFRNSELDAKNFFAPKTFKPPFRFNDFGGNLGGPIFKDKTFFFVNYEGSRQRIGISGAGTVPSALLKQQVLTTSPALAPIVALYPAGTSPTSNPLVDNYVTAQTSDVREDTASVKVDQRFGESDSLFLRVNVNDTHTFGPLFGVTTSALGIYDFQNVPIRTSNVALHEQHIWSPNIVSEFLVGAQRWGSHLISDEPYPQTTITGITAVPGDRGRSIQNATSYQAGGNTTIVRGAHTIKFGTTEYYIRVARLSKNTSNMTYTSLQDFVNNSVFSAGFTVGDPGHTTQATQIGLFVQDTYKVRPNLTIDYGLRYDYETVVHDSHDNTQPYDVRLGMLGPVGDEYYRPNKNDWGPRLGIAWQPGAKTVVRAGAGLFWQAYPVGFGSYSIPVNNIPGNTSLLRQTVPALSYPITNFLLQGTAPIPAVAGFDWIRRDIYTEQWDFSIARDLGNGAALQVAYVGNRGLNLRRGYTINFIDPTLGRRPNPLYTNISIEGNTGQSTYNALQVSYQQHLKKNLITKIEYGFSHAIDDVQDQGLFSSQPQDDNNFKAERGNSSGDIRQNLAFSVLFTIPMGQGYHFLGSAKGLGGVLASGWSLASLGLIHTGIPFTVFIGTNTYGNGNLTNQRPNAVAGVSQYAANKSINGWLNPAAFSLPLPGTFGNLGRNTVYGPGFTNVDFSVLKTTKFTETKNLEFRAEFFNIPNHPNFAQPSSTFNTSSFGQVFQTFGATLGLGTSRQIQLALKLNL
ncbi:MAG TPA: TonB-dependent receptor [Candidatus Acidoferrales bacterium]|nr:TonB-dependent receptor [Candidatus Acidoferrales bacterium]